MKIVLLFFFAFLLLVVAFFTFVILGAGSHGHLGLFDHTDSYYFYSIILGCFYIIFRINIYAIKSLGKDITKAQIIGKKIFLGIYILIILVFFSELFSDTPNIRQRDWIINILFSLTVLGEYIYTKKNANNRFKPNLPHGA